jgi:hypothetical protein
MSVKRTTEKAILLFVEDDCVGVEETIVVVSVEFVLFSVESVLTDDVDVDVDLDVLVEKVDATVLDVVVSDV